MWKVVARIVIWIQFAVIALAVIFWGGAFISEFSRYSHGQAELYGVLFIFIGILLDFVICSFMGMIIDMAFDVSKIAKNTEGLRYMTQIPMNQVPMGAPINPSPIPPVAPMSVPPVEPMPVPPVENNSTTWTCQCGKVNKAESNFCISCGTQRMD